MDAVIPDETGSVTEGIFSVVGFAFNGEASTATSLSVGAVGVSVYPKLAINQTRAPFKTEQLAEAMEDSEIRYGWFDSLAILRKR